MSMIIFERSDQKKNWFPPLLVVLVGRKKVGLKNGRQESFSVDAGTHKLTLRLRRLGANGSNSLKHQITVGPNDRVFIRCGIEVKAVTTQIWGKISVAPVEDGQPFSAAREHVIESKARRPLVA